MYLHDLHLCVHLSNYTPILPGHFVTLTLWSVDRILRVSDDSDMGVTGGPRATLPSQQRENCSQGRPKTNILTSQANIRTYLICIPGAKKMVMSFPHF